MSDLLSSLDRAQIGLDLIVQMQRAIERTEAMRDALGHAEGDMYQPSPGVVTTYADHIGLARSAEERLWRRFDAVGHLIRQLAAQGDTA